MRTAWKSVLKHLRSTQPLNFVLTSALRTSGVHSEFVIKHLHRIGAVRAQLPNGRTLRLWSRGDDWVSNQIYWRGWNGYEPESTQPFYQCATRARITLDVGAYIGFYSLVAGHANPGGKVFAFEPLPTIFERLQENVKRNGLANVECLRTAVGERDGTADFFHVSASLPTSSSLSEAFMRAAGDVRRSSVPVTSLDRFVRERNLSGVDLVKIDTESTEPQVLRGMCDILRRDRPTVFCEVLMGRGSERALEELLAPLGYRYYLLTPEGPIPRERVEGHPTWLNYLFAIPGDPLVPVPRN